MTRQIKDILKEHRIRLRKSWGQNFLQDEAVLEKIIQAAELTKDDLVLEVGAGTGILTERLAERASRVLAVELDAKLAGLLKKQLSGRDNIAVVEEDILKVDIREAFGRAFGLPPEALSSLKALGNLPYYITTPVIFYLLEQRSLFDFFLMLVQKEVAERMQAGPGSKDYGILSLSCQYYAEVEIITQVGRASFYPPPRVDSALVKMTLSKYPRVRVADEGLFFSLIKASFSQRRKTLENALRKNPYFILGRETLSRALERTSIEGRRRGETLSLQEFARLSDALTPKEGERK